MGSLRIVYGIISFVSVGMSFLVPDLLKPIFILVGFIFALLELVKGVKSLGVIATIVSLVALGIMTFKVYEKWHIEREIKRIRADAEEQNKRDMAIVEERYGKLLENTKNDES